jgi:hypothetical protein
MRSIPTRLVQLGWCEFFVADSDPLGEHATPWVGQVVVVPLRVNMNHKAATIEELIAHRKAFSSHTPISVPAPISPTYRQYAKYVFFRSVGVNVDLSWGACVKRACVCTHAYFAVAAETKGGATWRQVERMNV